MNKKKYIIVLLITAGIFVIAFIISNYINDRRYDVIKTTADKISIDILSLETQFELFQESSCASLKNSILSDEINALADKLSYAENQRGIDDADVVTLKKYYSLLEIKDYLLMKKVDNRCDVNPISILYFYTNQESCSDCTRQGYVLTKLRSEHPELKVYSFDYDLNLNAIKTLTSLYKVPKELPAIVINGKTYNKFQSIEAIQAIIPELVATSTATSTLNSKPIQK
jgi:uncharacterized protein with ParB-like and HNH nuclease domain